MRRERSRPTCRAVSARSPASRRSLSSVRSPSSWSSVTNVLNWRRHHGGCAGTRPATGERSDVACSLPIGEDVQAPRSRSRST